MNLISNPTRILLALSSIKGVGPAALKRVSNIAEFWELGLEEWASASPQVAKALAIEAAEVWRRAQNWADDQIVAAEKHNARIISAVDSDYPGLLCETRDDPFLLFVKGHFASIPRQSVAIIGTREPTQHGKRIAQRITQFFVEQRWSIVSGLALGCDSIAHQAALDAGGHTVAVMAHGLQMVAPSSHRKLAQDILNAGGALISEFPFGRDATGPQFVKRDRTQAGMAQGVVMIQSDIKGGSLHASRAALDYERWLAVPIPTDKDRENEEPKVQANLVITDGSEADRAALLRCPVNSLRLLRVVRGREDYFELIGKQAPSLVEDFGQTSVISGTEWLSSQDEVRLESTGAKAVSPDSGTQTSGGSTSEQSLSTSGEILQTSDVHRDGEALRSLTTKFINPSNNASVDDIAMLAEVQLPLEPTTRADSLYHLELSAEDWAGLKDLKIPWANPEFQKNFPTADIDLDVIVTFSRLGRVQAAVNDLWKVRPKRAVSQRGAGQVLFLIEDLLTHMKRAADQLLKLGENEMQGSPIRIMVKRGAANPQPELPIATEIFGPQEIPLVEALSRLVEALPHSVSVHGRKIGSSESELSVSIHLCDLLYSFNTLVNFVAPPGSYSLQTSVKAQATN